MKQEGEKEDGQGITLKEADHALNHIIAKDEVASKTVAGWNPRRELREVVHKLIKSRLPFGQVESIDKIDLKNTDVIPTLSNDGVESMNYALTSTPDTHSKLEGGEQVCSPLCHS